MLNLGYLCPQVLEFVPLSTPHYSKNIYREVKKVLAPPPPTLELEVHFGVKHCTLLALIINKTFNYLLVADSDYHHLLRMQVSAQRCMDPH